MDAVSFSPSLCLFLWWVPVSVCLHFYGGFALLLCVFAAKVIRQKLVNRQFPPTPTPPSPSLLPLLMLFRSFSVNVCVCLFGICYAPLGRYTRVARHAHKRPNETPWHHPQLRVVSKYLADTKRKKKQTEPEPNSLRSSSLCSAHAQPHSSYCISISKFQLLMLLLLLLFPAGCDMLRIWHANGIWVGAAAAAAAVVQQVWQWNFSGNINWTVFKPFSRVNNQLQLITGKFHKWKTVSKQRTALIIGRWFCQIPKLMTSWHSLTSA